MVRRQRNAPQVDYMEPRVLLSGSKAASSHEILSFSPSQVNVDGHAGSVQLTLVRQGAGSFGNIDEGLPHFKVQPLKDTVQIEVATTSDGGPQSASPVTQYRPIDQVVTFAPGQTSQTITIPLLESTASPGVYPVEIVARPVSASVQGASAWVNILVQPNVTLPKIVSTQLITQGHSETGATITFSAPMDPSSVTNPAAYDITPIIVPTNSYHYSSAISVLSPISAGTSGSTSRHPPS